MRLGSKCLLASGLSFILLLSLASLQHKGVGNDEASCFAYGTRILQGNPTRASAFNDSVMPFSALNALVSYGGGDQDSQILKGRYVTIAFFLVLAFLVFFWSRELYGTVPAFFSFFLFCFDPNLIAHGRLVTLDIYAALAAAATLYFYWRFMKYGGLHRALISALVLGTGQLAKYSSITLYPLLLMITAIHFGPAIIRLCKERNFSSLKKMAGSFIKYLLLFIFVSLIIVNIGFLFYKTFVPLKQDVFKSQAFQSLQTIPLLNSIPVPLPYPFIQGLDLCKFVDDTGETCWNTYLLGKVHHAGLEPLGFKGYFFIACLYKVPIANLLIIFLALGFYGYRYRQFSFMQNEIFFLLPILFFLIYYNFFINMDVGIRHILLIFPLLYVFCGSLFVPWKKYSAVVQCGFAGLMLYLAVSVLSYFPHFISYFNEFVPNRKMAYKILADSNLDWGGEEWYLKEYLKKHPDSTLLPGRLTSGHIIISANDLVGIFDADKFSWLRDNFKPVDQIAYSYLVFDLNNEQLKQVIIKYFYFLQF